MCQESRPWLHLRPLRGDRAPPTTLEYDPLWYAGCRNRMFSGKLYLDSPVGTQRNNNVFITSKRRHCVIIAPCVRWVFMLLRNFVWSAVFVLTYVLTLHQSKENFRNLISMRRVKRIIRVSFISELIGHLIAWNALHKIDMIQKQITNNWCGSLTFCFQTTRC